MKTPKIEYGRYIKEKCCVDCDYAGANLKGSGFHPPRPVSVCPECGGKLKEYIGRWKFIVTSVSWWEMFATGSGTKTTWHGFEKGRAVEEINNLSQKDCDCPGCKICNSGHGYQPCHNGEELGTPP